MRWWMRWLEMRWWHKWVLKHHVRHMFTVSGEYYYCECGRFWR